MSSFTLSQSDPSLSSEMPLLPSPELSADFGHATHHTLLNFNQNSSNNYPIHHYMQLSYMPQSELHQQLLRTQTELSGVTFELERVKKQLAEVNKENLCLV